MQQIKRAESYEWILVFDILDSCAKWLSKKGLTHWENAYTKEVVFKKVREKEVYLLLDGERVLGTITLSSNLHFTILRMTKDFGKIRISQQIILVL